MDFLNKTLAQLNDLFRSMTVGARITAALLLVVVVVSLVYLLRFQAGGPEVDLMHGMPVPATHLPLMETAFAKAGLTNYEVRGTQILVPRGQEAAYMAALADAEALPPNFGSAIRKAVETGNVFDSKEDKERRMRVATQEELSRIIASMQGIESAYVFYAVDTKYGLRREEVKTASVSVKPLGERQLDPADAAKIRRLVAGAFGMNYENVTVVDHHGRAYYGDGELGGSAEENDYVALTRHWEREYKAKILSSLSFIPNLTVEPIVILDRERLLRVRRTQLDPKPVAVRITEQTTSHTRQGDGPGGRVGYIAQQANTPTALAATGAGSQEQEDTSHTDTQSIPSGSQEERESVGLTPKQVKVSVGIPSSYFVKVWRERNPAAAGEQPKEPAAADLEKIRLEETAKIQAHVAALLPPAEGVDDLTQLVTVTTFTDLPSAPPPEPGMGKVLLVWLADAWRTLAVVGLALVSLVMLRSLVRAAPLAPVGPQPAPPGLFAAESPAAEQTAGEGAAKPRRFGAGGRSLRDELSELVQEDPDTAANILKSWIGSV